MEILIIADGATLPPAPAPTPTGTLEPVGLIPLASSSNFNSGEPFLAKVLYFLRACCYHTSIYIVSVLEGMALCIAKLYLFFFVTQDNDMSTSWTCNGSTTRSGNCDIQFSLFWFRHIKQVKIGKL